MVGSFPVIIIFEGVMVGLLAVMVVIWTLHLMSHVDAQFHEELGKDDVHPIHGVFVFLPGLVE